MKMAMANLPGGLSPPEMLEQLSNSLNSLLPGLSVRNVHSSFGV